MNLPIVQTRSCDGCSECCTTHEVVFDDGTPTKQVGQRCSYLTESDGCSIYDKRPQSCRSYVCLWASGLIPPHLKPDKVFAVLTVAENIIVVKETKTDAHRRGALRKFLSSMIEKGVLVAIDYGKLDDFTDLHTLTIYNRDDMTKYCTPFTTFRTFIL